MFLVNAFLMLFNKIFNNDKYLTIIIKYSLNNVELHIRRGLLVAVVGTFSSFSTLLSRYTYIISLYTYDFIFFVYRQSRVWKVYIVNVITWRAAQSLWLVLGSI